MKYSGSNNFDKGLVKLVLFPLRYYLGSIYHLFDIGCMRIQLGSYLNKPLDKYFAWEK